jgi:hypothetical protein
MSGLTKALVLQMGGLLQFRADSPWNYPIQQRCNSCGKVWCAAKQEYMDEFIFTIPGSAQFFVCPICRHMASYVLRGAFDAGPAG